jgi:hypothetical protein
MTQEILELLRRELPHWPESVRALIAVTELAALAALEVAERAKEEQE